MAILGDSFPQKELHKIKLLKDLVIEKNCFIVCLTESHLSDEIKECEVKILGYDIHRSDRVRTSHGAMLSLLLDRYLQSHCSKIVCMFSWFSVTDDTRCGAI